VDVKFPSVTFTYFPDLEHVDLATVALRHFDSASHCDPISYVKFTNGARLRFTIGALDKNRVVCCRPDRAAIARSDL
jgi:hypothetical protein